MDSNFYCNNNNVFKDFIAADVAVNSITNKNVNMDKYCVILTLNS